MLTSQLFRKRANLGLLFVCVLSIGILVAVYSFSVERGLTGRYYENVEWAGSPSITATDKVIDLQRKERELSWRATDYSIEWAGVIYIPAAGEYQFTTASDDGSWLVLDGQLIVDNGGYHGLLERSGSISLEKGFYPITIRYMQGGGVAELRVFWTGSGKDQEVLPHAFLFPEKPGEIAYFVDRILSRIFVGCLFVWLIGFIVGLVIVLKNRRRILPRLKTSRMGRVFLNVVAWMSADEEDSPPFSFLPQEERTFSKELLLVLLVSVFLNVCGIWWGLPSLRGWAPDELTPLIVQRGFEKGFSHGWYDKYPPFHYYVLTLSHLPFYLLDWLNLLDSDNFSIYTILFYIGRLISVFMGTATVFLVYLCGRELYEKKAALFAALIVALMAPFVYYAKITNLDIPYTFWFVGSLFFYIRILKHHRSADYLLFAVTATLAICTKDQAYGLYILTPIPIALSHYLDRKKMGKPANILNSFINRKTIVSLLLAVIVFFFVHNIFFNMDGFIKHVKLIIGPASQDYRMYQEGMAGHIKMLRQSVKHIRFAFGWPVFLVCLAGFVTILFRGKKTWLLFLILVPGISYYLTFSSIILYSYVRFFIPICITLAFFGGKCLSDILNPTRSIYKGKILLVSLILGYTFCYSASIDILMIHDSRYYVTTWMNKNISTDSVIGMVGLLEHLPKVTRFRRRKYITYPSVQALETSNPDYLIINSGLRFGNEDFYTQLNAEKLGYTLVFQYQSHPKLAILNHTDIYKNGQRDIITNLDKINPEIKIFKKIE